MTLPLKSNTIKRSWQGFLRHPATLALAQLSHSLRPITVVSPLRRPLHGEPPGDGDQVRSFWPSNPGPGIGEGCGLNWAKIMNRSELVPGHLSLRLLADKLQCHVVS